MSSGAQLPHAGLSVVADPCLLEDEEFLLQRGLAEDDRRLQALQQKARQSSQVDLSRKSDESDQLCSTPRKSLRLVNDLDLAPTQDQILDDSSRHSDSELDNSVVLDGVPERPWSPTQIQQISIIKQLLSSTGQGCADILDEGKPSAKGQSKAVWRTR